MLSMNLIMSAYKEGMIEMEMGKISLCELEKMALRNNWLFLLRYFGVI